MLWMNKVDEIRTDLSNLALLSRRCGMEITAAVIDGHLKELSMMDLVNESETMAQLTSYIRNLKSLFEGDLKEWASAPAFVYHCECILRFAPAGDL